MSEKLHLEEHRWLALWYVGGDVVGWGLVCHVQWFLFFFLQLVSALSEGGSFLRRYIYSSKMLIFIYKGAYINFVIMLSFFWRVERVLLLWRNFHKRKHSLSSFDKFNQIPSKGVHRCLRRKTCHIMAHSLILLLYISLR